ncbi:MAG: hypothetical protein AB2L07_06500 [Thermoanaerobaculaceae bacterium]
MPRIGIGLAAVASLTCVRLLAGRGQPFGLRDDGFMFLLSRAWAAGEDLYSSFHMLYQVGQYAYLGTVMRLLGDTVGTMRLGLALLAGLSAAGMAVAVRWAGASAWLAAAVGVAVAVVDPGLPSTLAMAAIFLAAAASVRRERPTACLVLIVSVLTGALLPWREDAALIGLALAAVTALRRRAADGLWIVPAGVLLGLAPWVGLALVRGELGSTMEHLQSRLHLLGLRLSSPRKVSGGANPPEAAMSPRQLVTAVLPLLLLVPPIIYGVLLVREAVSWLRRRALSPATVAATLVGVAFLPYLLWERRDIYHLRYHLPLLVAVVSVAVAQRGRRLQRVLAVGLGALAVTVAAALQVEYASQRAALYPAPEGRRIGARVPHGPPPWAPLPAAPGESLIVLPWGPGWYALETPRRGSRLLYAGPARRATLAQRRELAEDLQRPTNRWAITDEGFDRRGADSPWAAAAEVIREDYVPVQRWREWTLWERARRPGSRADAAGGTPAS